MSIQWQKTLWTVHSTRVYLNEQHKTHCVYRSKHGGCSCSHARISPPFVGIGTGPELEQNYNRIFSQWQAPSTWSPVLDSALPSFDLARFYILHQMSVRIIEIKIWFLFHCQENNVLFWPLLSGWPTCWESKYEILRLWNALTTKHHQYKTEFDVFCQIHFIFFCFFNHFWHTNLRCEEEFY